MTAYTLQRAVVAARSARFWRFFAGSAGGLAVDLGGFVALTAAGLSPTPANMVSSFASITVVYLLVTRYAFGASRRPVTYVAFVAWYTTMILAFSVAIGWAAVTTGLLPIVCKLGSVPVSFLLNYGFSRLLFSR